MARKPAKTTARKSSRAAAKNSKRKVVKAGKAKAAKTKKAKTKAKTKPTKTKKAKAGAARKAAKKSAARSARGPSKKSAAKARAPRARTAPVADVQPSRPPQRVAVSHYNNADFESGLRTYAQYRDLGIVDATHGMVRAHVLRFVEPCDPAVVSKLHFHDTQFQMVYVLKGWVKTELEGEGEVTMRQGSAWTQPPHIKHKINDYSEDAELLEVILPADFETVELTD
ncbi:MAG: cupin domain-containing protein [Rhizobiales bacterium]|nr:cupin domain-containing protein [Hyphomicrobiales bacterium]